MVSHKYCSVTFEDSVILNYSYEQVYHPTQELNGKKRKKSENKRFTIRIRFKTFVKSDFFLYIILFFYCKEKEQKKVNEFLYCHFTHQITTSYHTKTPQSRIYEDTNQHINQNHIKYFP